MRFIIRVIVNAFAIWVVTLIPALMTVVTPFAPGETLQLVLSLLAVAAVFAIVNSIIGTVIKIVAFPLYILTLGLISFLVNGLLLMITAWFTQWWGWGLQVEDLWHGILAAIVISLINWVFGIILRPQSNDRRRSR
ncbi:MULTISPECIES: phage holin family protein [unclassified Microbacterium]|uniref:phage holin family protein n=1 Tax=unclassified Microbacterium TaxID=2609290 RepID=UPI003016EE12